MRRERGFTLIEGLFSLLLVLLIMSALTKTLVNAGKVRANRENMDRAVDELHVLNGMRSELQGCLQLLEPSSSGSTLRLRTIDPDVSFLERIDPARGAGSPFEASEQVDISYQAVEGALRRTVTPVGGSSSNGLDLLSVSSFEASRVEQMVTLNLTFEYSRVRKERTLKVELR